MYQYTNQHCKPCYAEVEEDTPFLKNMFYLVPDSHDDDVQHACHTNLGSITVLNRKTGFGWRDTETGYRDPKGNFWLASGMCDVRDSEVSTFGEAIAWIKKEANVCNPDIRLE